ncbi:linoleate 9S-lipoxygenase 1 [Podospora australis]|uniref:Manganese lipoxygenase n=1 Tax=Podospora australis TaxID=1536484 RepID=A0AAN7AMW9_9PEZI|nr:linoleate 9S-lipoxygenase 1 [Podospora australis]
MVESSTTAAGPSLSTSRRLDQLESPLFGKLPAELRAAILTDIFGGRRIHLDFIAHPTRADRVGNRKRWRSGICEQPMLTPFKEVCDAKHYCLIAGRRRVLDTAFLFTCRRALEDGLVVLYQSNIFTLINVTAQRRPCDEIRSLQAKMPKNWPLVRSLEIKWNVLIHDRNSGSLVPHWLGREGYEDLWDALAEMPALSRLKIEILMPLEHPFYHKATSPAELRELYLGPIKRLKNLKSCELIFPEAFQSHLFGLQKGDILVDRDGDCRYRILWSAPQLSANPLIMSQNAQTSSLLNRVYAFLETFWVQQQLSMDPKPPTPPARIAAARATKKSILKRPSEKEFRKQIAWPESVKDAPLSSFDPGVFDNKLLKMKLYATIDPKYPSLIHAPQGKIQKGTYMGTQVALTQAYARIEQTFASLFDVLGIEPSLPRYMDLKTQKELYEYSAYPANDDGLPASYPPHLRIIPPGERHSNFAIFNAIGLIETQVILKKIIPQEDGIVGRTKEWLVTKARSAAFGGNPEKGLRVQDVVDYNKFHRKVGTDIMAGGNIGLLDDWYSDRRFADQQFTGTNPTTITKASEAWIADFLKAAAAGGYTKWEEALPKADPSSLFVQDGSYFRKAFGVSNPERTLYHKEPGSDDNWAVGAVTLFQLHDDGKLHPIAICIDYKGSIEKSVTIFNKRLKPTSSTSSEKDDWPWRYAKTAAQVTDWMRHELAIHLTLSHFVEEAIIVAVNRTIPMDHPVYTLLHPHWYKTLSLNAAARATLVPQVIIDLVGISPVQAYSFLRDAYDTYDFVGSYIPNDLERRGFPSTTEELAQPRYKNYPYAKNMLSLWNVLRSFVKTMLSFHYPTDEKVAADTYMQDWANEVQNAGFMPSFPELETVDALVDAVTMCIHIAAPFHSAINYLQNFYHMFVINKPPCLCREPPKTLEELLAYKEANLVASLPINRNRQWLLAAEVPWLLSFKVEDDRSLLNYAASQWNAYKLSKKLEEEHIKNASQKLYDDLRGLQVEFFQNSNAMDKGSIPYTVLDPGLTAVSILV